MYHLSAFCFIKLYTSVKKLWVKHASHQKSRSLIAPSLSKLGITVNNNYKIIGTTFIFTTLIVHTTISKISNKNLLLYFRKFSLPYSTLTGLQNHPYHSR